MKFDPASASPRQVEGYLRGVILKTLGDEVENASFVTARRGYYSVIVNFPDNRCVRFENFRKKDTLMIARSLRSLK